MPHHIWLAAHSDYGNRMGLALTTIALFASIPILTGAIAQIPVGYLSDRMDRRRVLIGLAIIAIIAETGFILVQPDDRMINLLLVSALGTAIYSMYPVIVAHASDHAPPNSHMQTSGGLLLVFGLGSIVGPLAAGLLMYLGGPSGLFITLLAAHLALVGFAVWRILSHETVDDDKKVAFKFSPLARSTTPETVAMASEVHEEADHDTKGR